jgi:hypothetical protein
VCTGPMLVVQKLTACVTLGLPTFRRKYGRVPKKKTTQRHEFPSSAARPSTRIDPHPALWLALKIVEVSARLVKHADPIRRRTVAEGEHPRIGGEEVRSGESARRRPAQCFHEAARDRAGGVAAGSLRERSREPQPARTGHPKTYVQVPHRLYHNLRDGRFADETERSGFGKYLCKGMGIGIADFNDDGWTDIFMANDTEPNFLYLNQANGTFKEVGLQCGVAYNDAGATVSAMGSDAKDYDNDGWVDVFYNNLKGQIWALFRNQGGKSFQYVSPRTKLVLLSARFSGWSSGFIDFDNDGWKDVYSANGDLRRYKRHISAARHDVPEHRWQTVRRCERSHGADFLKTGFQRGSAFADLNNGGFTDIVVTSLNEKPRILLNSAGNGKHSLVLNLRGIKSNRDAIGARVKVTTPSGRVLYNHVTTSVGFMSSSDRRLHFGF